jgi:hypothetical protein
MADSIQLVIDTQSGRLLVRTASGPARLAVIDSNGNVVSSDDIESRITDAVIDAVFEDVSHKQSMNR